MQIKYISAAPTDVMYTIQIQMHVEYLCSFSRQPEKTITNNN